MTRAHAAWLRFVVSRSFVLLADTAIMAIAYLAANVLRFDFAVPRWGMRAVATSFATVWVVQCVCLLVSGSWACAWRRMRAFDIPRYMLAVLLSSAILVLLRALLPLDAFSNIRPPYSVIVINAVMWSAGMLGVRTLLRIILELRQEGMPLMERAEAMPETSDVVGLLQGKCVLVTGAGGSIGSELVRQIVRCGPRQVVMVERGENALYEIDREMRQLGGDAACVPQMVDIADERRMREIFARYRPEIVLHAAAYKHVPMVEANPREGIRNNTLATGRLGELARDAGVERFVMISTDKAVNPAGVMGMTKRMAEILLMDLNRPGGTRFSAVRFGNVLGSSGSVVPLFREQIARHGPVTVTHPDMRRYFMTVQEAVGLVLQAAAFAKGGEVFVLDMGEPVRIIDLAERMIRKAGFRPYVDVPVRITGIRPGEKLFEELDVSEKMAFKTGHAHIFICRNADGDAAAVKSVAEELAAGECSEDEIRAKLRAFFGVAVPAETRK